MRLGNGVFRYGQGMGTAIDYACMLPTRNVPAN
jgi:hypothetical protein